MEFNEDQIRQIKVLARCHCTNSEIAAFMDVGETTLKRKLGPLLKQQREAGLTNLRRWQMKAAEKGNAAMLIWLGKQLLHQRDKIDHEVSESPQTIEQKKETLKAAVSELRQMFEDAKQCNQTLSSLPPSPLPLH